MPTTVTIAKLIGDVKAYSSAYINGHGWVKGKFNWQSGFAAFSCAKRNREAVIKYIVNQEQHHRRRSFEDEYVSMLRTHGVAFEERYLFTFIDLP
jgi:hypothetical protein